MVVIGVICPETCRPTRRYSQHDKQWRADGVLDRIMATLHYKVRQQVKKTKVDDPADD